MSSRLFRCFLVPLTLCLLVATSADAAPRVRDKADAPEHLQQVFQTQDDTASRRGFAGVHLARRSLDSSTGVERVLTRRPLSPEQPALIVARLDRFPSANEWDAWSDRGVEAAGYLGNRHWLVRVTRSVNEAFTLLDARSFVAYRDDDKIAPTLDREARTTDYYDARTDLVVVDVTLVDADKSAVTSVRDAFHTSQRDFVDNTGGRTVTVVLPSSQVDGLAALDTVIAIEPGHWEKTVLMDGVRRVVDAEAVTGAFGQTLTGRSVRAATNERLGLGAAHEDYFNHDSAGQPTTPRFSAVAVASCIDSSSSAWHGQMTAGILLGNGWQSERNGGQPFGFRGIAPQATLDCYRQTGAHAHVSSHSYVGTSSTTSTIWDAAVVGDRTDEEQHAHVAAGGNHGDDFGYFAMQNNAKNAMIVANAQVNRHIHPSSSSGPTHDGRIKPDITAPTGNYRPELDDGFGIEIEWIKLKRNGTPIYTWHFDSQTPLWHQGWGHTDNQANFGQLQLTASQTSQGNLRVDMDPKPWGTAWQQSPVLGTQVVPYSHPLGGGSPLNLFGDEDDVLEIRYRSVVTAEARIFGWFSLKPVWFRSFPPQNSSDWHSQGAHGAVGYADGLWHTLNVPVGLATDVIATGNPFWPDGPAWDGYSIQYLGLRFRRVDMQPTTNFPQNYRPSGGTSGASPVVGGAYALGMEHLRTLFFGTNLDDKVAKSAYRDGAAPPYGMPYNSTWKALFVHTARDLHDRIGNTLNMPPNHDTGVPTSYYEGPDYTTGYGMLKAQSGIDLMTQHAQGADLYDVIEDRLASGQFHTYEVTVPDSFIVGNRGIKVTLAWDDPPAYGSTNQIESKLVNNLGLVLRSPDGATYFPWTIDLPYEYDETNGPHVVEPEPITDADIVPARRDLPNDRDNLEQVQVDDLENSDQSGTWTIYVVDNGMGMPSLVTQGYSLIISPWNVRRQCHDCE